MCGGFRVYILFSHAALCAPLAQGNPDAFGPQELDIPTESLSSSVHPGSAKNMPLTH